MEGEDKGVASDLVRKMFDLVTLGKNVWKCESGTNTGIQTEKSIPLSSFSLHAGFNHEVKTILL